MRYLFLAVLTLLLAASPAFAQTSAPKITGVYSILHYNEAGGDLLGMELLVFPAKAGGYSAFVQIAEGGAPFTRVVPFFVEGSRISFVIPLEGAFAEMRFDGELKGTSLIINSPVSEKQTLRRGKSYWQ